MFSTISMGQLEQYLNQGKQNTEFLLLDVRDSDSFKKTHLEGAVNIPLEELEQNMGRIPRNRPVVIYCAHGSHSMMAARILSQLGYEVTNTAGGLAYYRGNHLVS